MTDENTTDTGQASSSARQGFALKVRLGQQLEKIARLGADLDEVKSKSMALAVDAERIKVELAIVAEALAKERG